MKTEGAVNDNKESGGSRGVSVVVHQRSQFSRSDQQQQGAAQIDQEKSVNKVCGAPERTPIESIQKQDEKHSWSFEQELQSSNL